MPHPPGSFAQPGLVRTPVPTERHDYPARARDLVPSRERGGTIRGQHRQLRTPLRSALGGSEARRKSKSVAGTEGAEAEFAAVDRDEFLERARFALEVVDRESGQVGA